MTSTTYFNQDCPTCGRGLRVRVEYLGKPVVCQHCGGQFEACDPTTDSCSTSLSGLGLIERADELLRAASSSVRLRPR